MRGKSWVNFNIITISLALMSGGFAGCTKHDSDGNLMVIHSRIRDDVKTMDPVNAYDVVSMDAVSNIYEPLYQYNYAAEGYHVVPLLAADMPKISADKLTVTIPIKHGVKFQDDPCFKETQGKGRELKAQDFVFEFKRLALPNIDSQGWWVVDGKVAGINAFHDKLEKAAKADLPKLFKEDVEGVRALDDYTLQLKLTKPYPQLLYVLCMAFTAPLPEEAITAYGDEKGKLDDHPVVTGPFVLKSWDRNRKIVLDRNPNYHGDFYPKSASSSLDVGKALPFADRVSIDIIKEEQPAWLNFMKGTNDYLYLQKDNLPQSVVNKTEISPKLAEQGIRLVRQTGVAFYYISFNMKDKILGPNKYLRQAISSAIDRDKWVETFTYGTSEKMVNALPPGVPDRPKNSKIKYDFDLARAKELMKKAGYPGGQGLPVINFDLRGPDSVNRQLGDFFTQQLAQIGIRLNPILNTFPAFLTKMQKGNLQLSYGGWSMDYPDAENVFQLLYGPNHAPGPNDANYDNPTLNKLYEKMAVTESSPARAATIQQMDDILQEDCPWALGYYFTSNYLVHSWLQNFRGTSESDIVLNYYKYQRVDQEARKRALER